MAIIVGPTASGKDCVINRMCERYPSVRKIVSYTTRQKRPQDIEGFDYHFLSDEEFASKKNEFVLQTNRVMGEKTVMYGMTKDDLLAVAHGETTICHMDLDSIEKLPTFISEITPLADLCLNRIIPIYLGIPRLTILKDRYLQRHRINDEKLVFRDRLRSEWQTWQKFKPQIPHTVMNDGTLDETVDQIVDLVNKLA